MIIVLQFILRIGFHHNTSDGGTVCSQIIETTAVHGKMKKGVKVMHMHILRMSEI
jgi:hypothetical protein